MPKKPNLQSFTIEVKCIIFWLNRGFMVYFDLYAPDKKKKKKKKKEKIFKTSNLKMVLECAFSGNINHKKN